ncbi:MAG: ATP-binding cassette domain-containing protein, partial [Moorea sp. SIO3I7]|nr:ATP-binding cassette domain-containing protein [Moorena sp. SIO3I7]
MVFPKKLIKGGSKVSKVIDLPKYGIRSILAKGVQMDFESGQNRVQVLKGIDWEVKRGDIQLLMGPSGSGKTTLLSILAG